MITNFRFTGTQEVSGEFSHNSFVISIAFNGNDIEFRNSLFYDAEGEEISFSEKQCEKIEEELRLLIYNAWEYGVMVQEYESNDAEWHQQFLEDERMGN